MAELKLPVRVGGRGRLIFDAQDREICLASSEEHADAIVAALNASAPAVPCGCRAIVEAEAKLWHGLALPPPGSGARVDVPGVLRKLAARLPAQPKEGLK